MSQSQIHLFSLYNSKERLEYHDRYCKLTSLPGGGKRWENSRTGERRLALWCVKGVRGLVVAEINVDGGLHAIGLFGKDCCEGYGFEEVEDGVPDECVDD